MAGAASRAAYGDCYHQQFEKDLKSVDPTDQGRIVAQLEAFMADWRGDVPFAELKSRWDYKQVDRIRGQAIMQVKVLRNYRVALMPVAEADPEMWFLHLYRRQTTNQEEIERAKERAKNILEHYVE